MLAVVPGAFWLLAALLLGYGLFGSGVLPQFEVVTLNHPGKRTQRYSVIRLWGSIGFVLAVLLVAQCLHAASFGLYHAVAVQCVHGCFRGALQGRGQALYSSVGFGVGGALGSFGAGHVWATSGAQAAWFAAALVALLGLLVAWCSGAAGHAEEVV